VASADKIAFESKLAPLAAANDELGAADLDFLARMYPTYNDHGNLHLYSPLTV
jgi:hypothetical protein